MSRPRTASRCTPTTTSGTRSPPRAARRWTGFTGDPSEIAAVGLCTIRCCKAFLRADGSLVEPVLSWMDDRAYQPYLPDDPALAYATTSSGYLAHRFTGELRDTAANNILLQWPIDTDTWQWSDDAGARAKVRRDAGDAARAAAAGRGDRVADAGGAAATGLPAGIPVVTTANDKAVEVLGSGSLGETTALDLARHLHRRRWCHGRREPQVAHRTSGRTSPACRTATSTRATACAAECGRSRGSSTSSATSSPSGPRRSGSRARSYIEREAELVPAGSDGLMTVLDWLAPTDKPFRKGDHARLRRPAHARPRLPLDPRGDRADDEAQRRRDVRRARHRARRDRRLGRRLPRARCSCRSSPTSSGSRPRGAAGSGGASLGAAICAAAGAGVYPDIETAAARMTGAGRESFAPDPANARALRADERDCLSRHPRRHRPAARARRTRSSTEPDPRKGQPPWH